MDIGKGNLPYSPATTGQPPTQRKVRTTPDLIKPEAIDKVMQSQRSDFKFSYGYFHRDVNHDLKIKSE